MGKHYANEYKKEVLETYLRGGNGLKQTSSDYNVAESSLREWVKRYSEESRNITENSEYNAIEDNGTPFQYF